MTGKVYINLTLDPLRIFANLFVHFSCTVLIVAFLPTVSDKK